MIIVKILFKKYKGTVNKKAKNIATDYILLDFYKSTDFLMFIPPSSTPIETQTHLLDPSSTISFL